MVDRCYRIHGFGFEFNLNTLQSSVDSMLSVMKYFSNYKYLYASNQGCIGCRIPGCCGYTLLYSHSLR